MTPFDTSMTFTHAVCFHWHRELFCSCRGENFYKNFCFSAEMLTTCKACNNQSNGMISIFHHPNGVDKMYTFVSGIEDIREDDAICIPCYDDLKIAHNFKQKCIQSNLLQKNDVIAAKNCDLLDNTLEIDEKPNINHETTIATEPIDVDVEEIAPSSTSLERSILLDQHSVVECETVEGSEEDDDLYDLLNIEKRSSNKSIDRSKIDCIGSTSVSDQMGVGHPEAELTEVPSQSNSHACNECGKYFNRSGNLKRHQESVHGTVTQSAKNPKGISTTPKQTQCEYCFLDFGSELERVVHESKHVLEDKPYKCFHEDCKSEFQLRATLLRHIESHTKVKKYKCRYCDQRFHQLGNAKSHERYHTGEKPYQCDHCGKSFAESGNLKAHIRFHTGERPYACPECPKRFTTHYSHKIHIRSHTQEKPYLCSDCGKRFTSSGKLLVHKRIHTGSRPYKCDVCSATFVDSSNLKRHSKIHTTN